ncbi:MAG: response regulator [Nitrospirae bacterium]|nr:response regulator [Nitrospirota bacterium]MBF0536046.1 response regulator [Nitrospirota bacterium]MBF0617934.1 response regulator [Nitrospirota bacterium]
MDHKSFLKKSVTIPQLCEHIKELMEKYDIFLGKNAILVIITCLDDQCSTVIEFIKREMRKFHPAKYGDTDDSDDLIHLEKFYGMRLFGGIFIPKVKTYESLLPASHHIPERNDGKLLILNFSHIGYDSNTGSFGVMVRYGHEKSSPACGAIKFCYDKILAEDDPPADADLKSLSKHIKKVVKKYKIKKEENGYDILEVTLRAFDDQIPWVTEQLSHLAVTDQISILYMGGVEVDYSKNCDELSSDRMVILKRLYIDKSGKVETMDKMLTVLIVDDEPIVGKRLKPALEKMGCEVEIFENPRLALSRIMEKEFDVVVTDIRMDEVDGLEVLETVRTKSERTKVVLITGYAMMELARQAMEKGAFDFIAKPFKPDDLRNVIMKAAESLGFTDLK